MKLKITGSGENLKVNLVASFDEIVTGVDFATPIIELAVMAGLTVKYGKFGRTGREVISKATGLPPVSVSKVLNNDSSVKFANIERIVKTCVELIREKGADHEG